MAEDTESATYITRLDRPGPLVEVGEYRLQQVQKDTLLEIAKLSPTDSEADTFIAAIEREIAKFLLSKDLEKERQAAADTRKTLKRLASALRKLTAELADMPDKHWDAYARLSLGIQSIFCPVPPSPPSPPPWNPDWQDFEFSLGTPPASVESFISLLQRDLQVLQDATQRALALGRKDGQRPKAARDFLARGVAQVFREHLQENPTTTTDGRFEQVLRFCLQAGGEYVGDDGSPVDLHTLIMKTLKSTKPSRK